MRLAPDFSGKYALILEGSLPAFDRAAALAKNLIALVPDLLADDCRNGLAGFIFIEHPFLLRQKALLTGAVIDDLDLVAAEIALVFRVLDDAGDRVVVDARAVSSAVALIPEDALDLARTVIAGAVKLDKFDGELVFYPKAAVKVKKIKRKDIF